MGAVAGHTARQGGRAHTGPELSPRAVAEARDADHFYKVFVQGYVLVKLPVDTAEDQVIERAIEMAQDGYAYCAGATIYEEWDE